MLIEIITSTSVRGWEGNETELIETDHTSIREFVIQEILMLECDMTREESIEELDGESDWGGWTDEGDQINHEGEECCTTHQVFEPDQEYLEMIQRHVKK